ncbi:hypothetical protein SAY86_007662 [Trapa natans]|uniref:Uncharacterized protein n=1 Tax=Trapa natans TaxID=22666 RepID=A0AAN7R2D4_TRANT|nr:hypothetical protein SAY86_007662 [Trapa natans]
MRDIMSCKGIGFDMGCDLAKDVVESLANASDSSRSLIDASDMFVLFIEIARLYGAIGYHRMAAFYSRGC